MPVTVTITDNKPGTAKVSTTTIVYTLVFSEPVTGLSGTDFSVTNIASGVVAGSGTTYTVTVVPLAGVNGNITLTLNGGAVQGATAETNAATSAAPQPIYTIAPPKLVTNAGFRTLVDPQVTFQTTMGNVVMELDQDAAPVTVANMLAYVYSGYYIDTLFHRVIPGFVAQGGGFASGMMAKPVPYAPIVLESNNGLHNLRGTLAMARTTNPDTATSQFFVNLVNNSALDYVNAANPGYAVFGQVVSGMSVIDAMAQQPTGTHSSGHQNVPLTDIKTISAQQTRNGSAVTKTGVFTVAALETSGNWQYSLDAGQTWLNGTGTSLTVPEGIYRAGSIQVRHTSAAGNPDASAGYFGSKLAVDLTAPALAGLLPGSSANAAVVSGNLVLTFAEAVERGTGTIVLKTAGGTVIATYDVATSDRITVSGKTLVVDPAADLAPGTGYTVEVSAGVVKDIAGNAHVGASSHNFTTGTAGVTVPGTGGNDTLQSASSANDTLDGGAGVDTAAFAGTRAEYVLFRSGSQVIVGDTVNARNGSDAVANAEFLLFSDRTVDLGAAARAATISAANLKTLQELYVGFFNRVPEAAGLGYWIEELKAGVSMATIANRFYDAGVQFGNYPATMTNQEFIREIYKNVLGRPPGVPPTDGEVDYWNQRLLSGQDTKGTMVLQMLSDVHNFFENVTDPFHPNYPFQFVADHLNNKAAVANYYAVEQGLSLNVQVDNIAFGQQLAQLITPTDISAAIALIGVNDFST